MSKVIRTLLLTAVLATGVLAGLGQATSASAACSPSEAQTRCKEQRILLDRKVLVNYFVQRYAAQLRQYHPPAEDVKENYNSCKVTGVVSYPFVWSSCSYIPQNTSNLAEIYAANWEIKIYDANWTLVDRKLPGAPPVGTVVVPFGAVYGGHVVLSIWGPGYGEAGVFIRI